MTRSRRAPTMTLAALAALSLSLSACTDKEKDKSDDKKEDKKEEVKEPEPEPTPAEPRFDLSGPVPPETSAVLFSVDGALLPIGCFNKDKGELAAGSDCAALVAEGSEVYMEDSYGKKALDKTGAGTKDSLCGDAGAIPAAGLEGGAAYDWAVFPKSLGDKVTQVDPDTWSDRGARLEEAEAKAVQEAMSKIRNVQGDFVPKQKAKLDIDGDGKEELFMSAALANPSDPDEFLVSALFMAPGGDLGQVQVVDLSKKKADVIHIRGAVDLDGDGKRELWVGITFDGGNGDRVITLGEGEAKPLGKWTCGA